MTASWGQGITPPSKEALASEVLGTERHGPRWCLSPERGRVDLTGANLGHNGRHTSQPKALWEPRRQCLGPPVCQEVQSKEISFSGHLPGPSPNASPGHHPHHQHCPTNQCMGSASACTMACVHYWVRETSEGVTNATLKIA